MIDLYNIPSNNIIAQTMVTAYNKLNDPSYRNIVVCISGGSDSDIMLDIVMRVTKPRHVSKIKFLFFDTGLEYQVTKAHIEQLEKKYGIDVIKRKPEKSVGVILRDYGVPFLSKFVSNQLERCNRINFNYDYNHKYDDEHCKKTKTQGCMKWWCQAREVKEGSRFTYNIDRNKLLKEFLSSNPPTFKISSKCCDYLKKKMGYKFDKENDIELKLLGLRRAEGGVRASVFKNCFSKGHAYTNYMDNYRPLFFWHNSEKDLYKNYFNLQYSDCYEKWGFTRTGCAGCPYNPSIFKDLEVVKQWEPNMYRACNNLFGESYEYTRRYKKFKDEF